MLHIKVIGDNIGIKETTIGVLITVLGICGAYSTHQIMKQAEAKGPEKITYQEVEEIPTGINFPVSIGADLVDLDKDGDMDAVIGVPEGVKLLENRSGYYSEKWLFKTNYETYSIKSAVALGDIDNDNDIDIAYAVPEGVRLLENQGKLKFKDLGWVIKSSENTSATGIDVKITDIDNDKKPEIVYSSTGKMKIYKK